MYLCNLFYVHVPATNGRIAVKNDLEVLCFEEIPVVCVKVPSQKYSEGLRTNNEKPVWIAGFQADNLI